MKTLHESLLEVKKLYFDLDYVKVIDHLQLACKKIKSNITSKEGEKCSKIIIEILFLGDRSVSINKYYL